MIHHHPYDEYEASRASHFPRGSHRSMPSPPSFYAIPPPIASSGPGSSADTHHNHHPLHQHHPHHMSVHSQHHPQQHPTMQGYYPSAPHPYMTHYPPPPPPAIASIDSRDRASLNRKQEYDEHAPFSPFDYPRHYTYGAKSSHPPSSTPSGYHSKTDLHPGQQSEPPSAHHEGRNFELTRGVKTTSGRNSTGGEAYALGDQQPTYVGHIKSANDAILLLSACDLPATAPLSPNNKSRETLHPPPRRVTRRLLDAERADLVASGSVFVWDEKEAGMKRWTDGRVWSASRVSGCFLTYRELEARKKVSTSASSMVEGPSSNQYKPDGLIKQSFSITTASGRKLHVISYFTKRDIREGRLRRVSEDPRFVGEAGGEWDLKVDEEEYSFPDMQTIGRGQGQGENGISSVLREQGDEDDSDMSDLSDRRSPSPRQQQRHSGSAVDKGSFDAKRKRSFKEEEEEAALQRQSSRPRLTRLRSMSMSGLPMVGQTVNQSSIQSNSSSLATTIPSEPSLHNGKDLKMSYNHGLSVSTNHGRSSAIRALVSPTLPRESALRDSACEMKPTQSQDCANAVGALLSLAGNSNGIIEAKDHSRVASPTPGSSSSSPTSSSSAQQVGLGLNVKPLPKRRDLDLAALNKFSVRL